MFVERDVNSVIVAIYACSQPNIAEELLPVDDQQILDFYARLKEIV